MTPRRAPKSASSFARRARAIRLLIVDVDGVLTDGRLYYGPHGEEWKVFHVHDGLALRAAQLAGLQVAIVSGRASVAVSRRMTDLGIKEVHQDVADKSEFVPALLGRIGVSAAEVAYMGDDLPDLPLLRSVGLALAPADAAAQVLRAAHRVTRRPGGGGAVREAVEAILTARGAWPPHLTSVSPDSL